MTRFPTCRLVPRGLFLRGLPLRRLILLAVVAAVSTGCASPQPYPYAGLASTPELRPNPADDSGHVPYRLPRTVDWGQYGSVIVDPVIVYRGADHQFEDISDDDKAVLAGEMRRVFAAELKQRFRLTTVPDVGTLLVRLTLTGAKTTTRVVSTFTRFDLAGGPYNAVQAVRGKEGAFTGSISYAVEILDASTQELLGAYVTKQYPNAWNLGATFGRLDAARVGIDKGAEDLLAQLR
ncbi:DUF3313 domain-containing protein [Roseateles sp. UC29_93]|uniref:DUF3313 domain-containing protein n=1 Tax=Roseateles sp. UC29_93 TaxID=3350177 RepID=UPI00366CC658